MTNHPNRRQVRLSLTLQELESLVDVLNFAKRQGYHPMTDYAAALGATAGTDTLATKANEAWKAVHS